MIGSPSSLERSSFDLERALTSRSWAWLTAKVERLGLGVELISESGALGPPVVSASGSEALRRLLTSPGSPALRAALPAAILTGQHQRLALDGLDMVFAPFAVAGATVGAVVVAHRPQAADPDLPVDLHDVAAWLVPSIEAELEDLADTGESFDRVASLHRLLVEAVEHGDERDVLAAFAEAVLAWDGVEVKGFAEDLDGQFVLAVATPGADRTRPRTLPADGPWFEQRVPTRLAPGDARRLGFPEGRDVQLVCVGGAGTPGWRLALSGAVGAADEPRLALYVNLLSDALARVATVAETRVTWAVLQQLLAGGPSTDEAGERALAELARAVDAAGAALVVSAPTGLSVLSLGDGEGVSAAHAAASGHLASTVQAVEGNTMRLAVRRPKGQSFTRRELQLVERVATVFASWLPGVLKGLGQRHERRTESRGFDVTMDRVAGRSLDEGQDVTALVIVAPSAPFQPGLLQEWVGRIRAQLRASDVAGALSEREIGVLLSGVSSPDVPALRARVLRNAGIDESGGAVAVGTASWGAGSGASHSLVHLARQDAARRAQEPTTACP